MQGLTETFKCFWRISRWCFSSKLALFLRKLLNTAFLAWINPFVPNAPFLYSLKTLENLKIFSCFQVIENGWIGKEQVKDFLIKPWWIFVIAYNCFMRSKITENAEKGINENKFFFIDACVWISFLPIKFLNCSLYKFSICIFTVPSLLWVEWRKMNL